MKKLFTFLCAIVVSNTLFAQIPNPGFETWDTTGSYDKVAGWDTPDSATAIFSVYPCTMGTPGAVGARYIKLTPEYIITAATVVTVPGVAVSGKINFTTFAPESGFPYTTRSANLTGSWQYHAAGADQGHIMVLLTKWNSTTSTRDTVSFTDHALPSYVVGWTTFSIPLAYQSTATPDSGIILLSSSGATPVAGSYLYVDNLAFAGIYTTGVTNVVNGTGLSVSPNPATGTTTIAYNSAKGGDVKISVSDMNGRSVSSFTSYAAAGKNKFPIDLSGLAKGLYIVRIIDGGSTEVQKLIVE